MKYPNNDLWSVRQIEFLKDALNGYENKSAIFYPTEKVHLSIPGVSAYEYVGVLYFPNQDRTIIFEQGNGYGLKYEQIIAYLEEINIKVEER
jgi:hypothetical protein